MSSQSIKISILFLRGSEHCFSNFRFRVKDEGKPSSKRGEIDCKERELLEMIGKENFLQFSYFRFHSQADRDRRKCQASTVILFPRCGKKKEKQDKCKFFSSPSFFSRVFFSRELKRTTNRVERALRSY